MEDVNTESLDSKIKQVTNTSMNLWIYRGAVAILALGLGTILLVIYWLSIPAEALVINNNPVPVHPRIVQEKDAIVATVDYCKKTNAKGQIKRFIGTQYREIPLPLQVDTVKKGCDKIDVPLIMPDNLRSSPAHIRWEAEYQINPLRTVHTEFFSQDFQIDASR